LRGRPRAGGLWRVCPSEEKVDIVRRLQELGREIKESRDENEGLRREREPAADG
jgi:hypothetical protein